MITIEGTARKEGVAIAVAAVVDAVHGINSVAPSLLEAGLQSLRRGLQRDDFPEAVVACDSAAVGVGITIPGVTAVGLAAQSDSFSDNIDVSVPCVTGLPNLLKRISPGDIVIVDGNRGIVHVDPTPSMLVHYQSMQEERARQAKVFLASEHIAARTQTGETVLVHAFVAGPGDVARALDCGADGLIVDLRKSGTDDFEALENMLLLAAGKPTAVVVQWRPVELFRAAMLYTAPGQLTVLFPADEFEPLRSEADSALESVRLEAFLNDLPPPQVHYGVIARETQLSASGGYPDELAVALDLRRSAYLAGRRSELSGVFPQWVGGRRVESLTLIVGPRTEVIPDVTAAGARSIATSPDRIGAAKSAIRLIGAEEAE